MMDVVNIHEAKTNLSRLIDQVEHGEEIIIARNGRPVARLAPYVRPDRVPGKYRGQIVMRDDFDDPLPDDIQEAFEGRGR